MKMNNLDSHILRLHCLTLQSYTKSTKTKQCSKRTSLQVITQLNVTTNTSIKNGKQVKKQQQTPT